MTGIITRFAPSPTGLLHLGNARTALFSWMFARGQGGRCLLRIEDTDHERSGDGWLAAQCEDLAWLGLDWDAPTWRQSERLDVHTALLDRLHAAGRIYPCFCTQASLAAGRAAQHAAGRPPRYAGTCAGIPVAEARRRIEAGEAHGMRFRVPQGRTLAFEDMVHGSQRFASDDIGDFIVRRADGTPAFLFSNAVDDAEAGITHVIRGDDHLSNTPRQLMLLEALGLDAPIYAHLPLLLTGAGTPMSKREGPDGPVDTLADRASPFSVRHFRTTGHHPLALVNYIARLGCSWPVDDSLSLMDLAVRFDVGKLGSGPARFDERQLEHWQRVTLDALPTDAWWDWIDLENVSDIPASERDGFLAVVRPNVLYPGDVQDWAQVCFGDGPGYTNAAMETIATTPASFFEAARDALVTHAGDAEAMVATLSSASGKRGKALYAPLRAALTGRLDGPSLAGILGLMGQDRASARLTRAREAGAAGC